MPLAGTPQECPPFPLLPMTKPSLTWLQTAPEGGVTVHAGPNKQHFRRIPALSVPCGVISGACLCVKKPMALVSLVSDVLKTPTTNSPLGLCFRPTEPAHSSKSRWKKVVFWCFRPSRSTRQAGELRNSAGCRRRRQPASARRVNSHRRRWRRTSRCR